MSPVPDDFEQLRRLLALKKYEQPPPGYFHSFSRQVIVRIKAGDAGNEAEASFWSFGNGSLFQRIWETLDARPVLAGAFGVAVCGFFVVGALLSENGTATAGAAPEMQPTRLARVPASTPVWQNANTESSSLVGAVPNYQPPASSLFDEIKNQQTAGSWQASPQSVIPKAIQVSFPQ